METFWEVSQFIPPLVALIGWIILTLFFIFVFWLYAKKMGEEFYLSFVGGISGTVCLCIIVVLVLINTEVRQYKPFSEHHYALLQNGELAKFGYTSVTLAPWPLPTKYEVVKYPNTTTFESAFQPITTNPKVIPLKITVICNMDETPEVVKHYALNSEAWEKAVIQVQKEGFEFFQHRLSQEQTNALNPYDPEKMDRFHGMVTAELTPRLPFGLKIGGIQLSLK